MITWIISIHILSSLDSDSEMTGSIKGGNLQAWPQLDQAPLMY